MADLYDAYKQLNKYWESYSCFYLGFIKAAQYPASVESGWVNVYNPQEFMDMDLFSEGEPDNGWDKEMCVGAFYKDEEVKVIDISCHRGELESCVAFCIVDKQF